MNKITIQDIKLHERLESWTEYTIEKQFDVFNKTLNEVGLSVHNKINFKDYIEQINEYVTWLNNCQNTLENFYKNEFADWIEEFGFDLSDWYDTLELYRVTITLTENGQCCADISGGDNVFEDHILDISFLGHEIESMGLDG